jgi:hypothetical protein
MADSPIITCPACQKKFKGKGDLEGKKIKCPLCAKVFVVPGAKKTEAVQTTPAGDGLVAMAPTQAPLGFADDEEDDNDPNPYGVTDLDIAPRCPNCAALMADEKAFICLFCGYNTLTREVGKTQKTIGHTAGERFVHLFPGLAMALTGFGFILGMTYFSVVLPDMVQGSWLRFLDHESLRMWFTIMALGVIWGCGTFAYKRLIVQPTPAEKIKDK